MKTIAFIILGLLIALALSEGLRANFPDTWVYYNAGRDSTFLRLMYQAKAGENSVWGWVYPDFLKVLWKPLAVFPYRIARILWFVLQAGIMIYLIHRLTKETKYAWLIVLALSWPITLFLSGSNIQTTLLFCSLSPFGAAVATCVKPYFALILLVHLWAETRAMENDTQLSHERVRDSASVHPGNDNRLETTED